MPKNTRTLESINVPTPCQADWDSMKGNDEVRFCSHCEFSVYNLSAMTRREALRLVAESNGRLCVRYYRKPSGELLHAVPHHLHQIKRRASRFAAGAFTAALSLSASINAQTPSSSSSTETPDAPAVTLDVSSSDNPPATQAQQPQPPKIEWSGTPPPFSGTILDPNGAVMPGVNVTLTNEETGWESKTMTDDSGVYSFQYVAPGSYKLRAEVASFATREIVHIAVKEADGFTAPVELNVNMKIGTVAATVGIIGLPLPRVPLVAAAAEDNLDLVRQLINSGADANEVDENTGSTALEQAVGNGNLEMVRGLLAAGARVNPGHKNGRTALLHLEADTASAELVWTLVSAGAKVNQKAYNGDTILIRLADQSEDNPEVLQALIDAGAKVNTRNKEGETALFKAAGSDNIGNVRVLLQAGADPNIKNNEGDSALEEAHQFGTPEVIELLLAYGAKE